MKRFLVAVLLLAVNKVSNGENCDHLGVLIYEDMDCKPSYEGDNACPTKYECQGLELSNHTCFYKGHVYNIGDVVQSTNVCQQECVCLADGTSSSVISCAHNYVSECPHFLEINVGCYWKKPLDKCCATELICGLTPPGKKCVVGGKTYNEGEIFTPKGTCYRCICDERFNGTYEASICERAPCGVQVYSQNSTQNKCAPLYMYPLFLAELHLDSSTLCCPQRWICPDGTEQIKHGVTPSTSDAKCSFGSTSLNIGDYFESEVIEYRTHIRKIKCECKIPPLLTCTGVPDEE